MIKQTKTSSIKIKQKIMATPKQKTILPPSTIGILGGGQLGRMIALEAREMGYSIVTLDPTENCPCAHVADEQVTAQFNSIEGAQELAAKSDVITYEFENISSDIAHHLESESFLPQGYNLLYITQNRLREKQAIQDAGGMVAPYVPVQTEKDLEEGLFSFGKPSVLKTAEGGYDGKGQIVIKDNETLLEAKKMISSASTEWILEKFVRFEKEISVIVARNGRGEVKSFPASENIHRENILHLSIVPARINQEIEEKAIKMANQLAESFQLIGLLAIEMFLLEDGTIYINEMAPRPHNSGHYTQEGCLTSQFEQHVRAVCNLPLGDVSLLQPTVMVNILGEHLKPVLNQLPTLDPSFKLHLYGKKEAIAKRKMGHLNVVARNVEEAMKKINELNIW
jgi:5-(carboxyamino)imidazole ribonucleotide synthase